MSKTTRYEIIAERAVANIARPFKNKMRTALYSVVDPYVTADYDNPLALVPKEVDTAINTLVELMAPLAELKAQADVDARLYKFLKGTDE